MAYADGACPLLRQEGLVRIPEHNVPLNRHSARVLHGPDSSSSREYLSTLIVAARAQSVWSRTRTLGGRQRQQHLFHYAVTPQAPAELSLA